MVLSYVPRKEGRGGITGLEASMGSLNMTFSRSVKHGGISSIWLRRVFCITCYQDGWMGTVHYILTRRIVKRTNLRNF